MVLPGAESAKPPWGQSPNPEKRSKQRDWLAEEGILVSQRWTSFPTPQGGLVLKGGHLGIRWSSRPALRWRCCVALPRCRLSQGVDTPRLSGARCPGMGGPIKLNAVK